MSGEKRFYMHNQTLPYDEDMCHEFKGHRNITLAEVPPHSQRTGSQQPLSKTINAFLNTGVGGTIYCGVKDDGVAPGLNFSPYQMDHMRVSLQDLMGRFKPPVPPHRWQLDFVPTLHQRPSAAELEKIFELSCRFDAKQRERSHVIGTSQLCWCDKDAVAAFNNNILYCDYVAEIIIHPWDACNPLDADMVITKTKVHPIHESEDGKVFIRKNASVQTLTLQDVIELTKSEVRSYYANRK